MGFTGSKSAFIYSNLLSQHSLNETHPLKPVRLAYTYDLLRSYRTFEAPNTLLENPRPASKEELLLFHTPRYIEAVQSLGKGDGSVNASEFNLGAGDNPVYDGMYEAASWSTGASIRGAELLADGKAKTVLSISGGLHHAMPGHASGFCVFNDPVIAIKTLLQKGMRVAYIDMDAHHGDGVQHAFYDTDTVLTISLHESGEFIFPGTGFAQEIGIGAGRGYSVNIPLYPYTTDEVYLKAFREVVIPLLRAFRPDVLATQLGIDSHFRDPITHLALTVQGFGEIISELHQLNSVWLAFGGGGYDLQSVARAWTLAFGTMSGLEIPNKIPLSYKKTHRVSTLRDSVEPKIPISVRKDAERFAENSIRAIHHLVFPTHHLGVL